MDQPFAYLLQAVNLSREAYYIPLQSYDHSVYIKLGSEKSLVVTTLSWLT